MKKKSASGKSKLLTEVESELMAILWRLKEGTVTDVIAGLPPDRKLAYTSVSTMLRILEQKKVLGSRKEGRGHVYYPLLKKERYEETTLKHVVHRVFDDAPSALVKRLLEVDELSEDDLRSIKNLIDEKLS